MKGLSKLINRICLVHREYLVQDKQIGGKWTREATFFFPIVLKVLFSLSLASSRDLLSYIIKSLDLKRLIHITL